MGRGKFKAKPTGRRNFSSHEDMVAGTSTRPRTFRQKEAENEEEPSKEVSEDESEEESEDENTKAKGVQGVIEIENPNLVKPKNIKARDIDIGKTSELSRREREEIEKQRAHERYMKLQEQGKTEQSRKDLDRLALIRQERAEAAKKREEERLESGFGFGAVCYSLRQKKKLDFTLKVIGGDISAIPGLYDAIEGAIRDAVEDSITWPVRKIVPILPGDYSVEDASTQHLYVKVYDNERLQSSELIGCADLKLSELQPGKVKDAWLKLLKDLEIQRDNKNRGQVHLELLYCPYDTENSFTNPFSPSYSMTSLEKVIKSSTNGMESNGSENEVAQRKKEVIIRGVLSITVISAEDLPAVDFMGKSDPFVVLTLKKAETKNKTRL
ncbi:hypothetical protein KIW84_073051 [Lathyrus oleraceus]|uniref:C2 domain-containing protein n=1 Tax=Pisum sativum TaxID=3888 RepID=A0A9D4VPU0_PEA|nr:hypothetical protein KIW84_073051 [Pisum sativum]